MTTWCWPWRWPAGAASTECSHSIGSREGTMSDRTEPTMTTRDALGATDELDVARARSRRRGRHPISVTPLGR